MKDYLLNWLLLLIVITKKAIKIKGTNNPGTEFFFSIFVLLDDELIPDWNNWEIDISVFGFVSELVVVGGITSSLTIICRIL